MYRSWALQDIEVCPILLPGRESRLSEPPIDNMPELLEKLAAAIRPYTDLPFAFFGHSMGAGIAFELTRILDRHPRLLVASAARAPQYRTNLEPRPDPPDADLLDQLSRLGGDREALAAALPILRADTRLYRNYRFEPGPPIPVPIAAYGGMADPNIRSEHLEPWSQLTSRAFRRREFPGGHFYLETDPDAVQAALTIDLADLPAS